MGYSEMIQAFYMFALSFGFTSIQSEPGYGLNHWFSGFGSASLVLHGTTFLLIRIYCFPNIDDGLAHRDLQATHGIIIAVMTVCAGVLIALCGADYVIAPYSLTVSQKYQDEMKKTAKRAKSFRDGSTASTTEPEETEADE